MISILYPLVFPYIFLLFDCFKWALIDRIVKCKFLSVLWQFQPGGVNLKFYPGGGGGGVNLTIYPKSANEL